MGEAVCVFSDRDSKRLALYKKLQPIYQLIYPNSATFFGYFQFLSKYEKEFLMAQLSLIKWPSLTH